MDGSCSVAGCMGNSYASGLCSKHYNRLRTTGTTEDGPRARAPLDVRFWKNVKRGAPDECWLWIGKSRVKGYGYIAIGGKRSKKEPSNRAAWILTYGAIPRGAVVRHKCHNRLCCNPEHLILGSRADNVADMWARPDGAPKGNAKLSWADVLAIRKDKRSSRQIAPVYGVTDAHIRRIRSGCAWEH